MSTAVEIAKAEADEAEAAEEEEGTDDDATEEEQPAPPPPPPGPDAAKVAKQLDGEANRHEAAIRKIMGEDYELLSPCPACAPSPAGFVFPLSSLPPEAQDAIRQELNFYMGSPIPDPSALQPAADMEPCDKCAGWGVVRSGSKNPNHVVEICGPCTGNGWRRKAVDAPPTYAPPVAVPAPAGDVEAPYRDAQGGPCWIAPDAQGRPFGDPHHGHGVA